MTDTEPHAPEKLLSLEPELLMLPLWRSLTESRAAIDVGAHVGNYTAALIDAGFETWCFEPNPSIFQRLAERFRSAADVHPIKMAASSQSRILPIHLASYRGGGDSTAERDALFSALDRHPAFEGFEFVETTTVVAWPLSRLALAGMVPSEIGILKIDTEGHDPEVLRGLEDLRPEIITVEYWNRDFVFNRGQTKNDVGDYVGLLSERGYSRSITFYRCSDEQIIGFSTDRDETPTNSWGNIVFFSDRAHFEATLDWCRALFEGGEPGHGGGLALREQGEDMLGQIRNRYAMLRSRLGATVRSVAARSLNVVTPSADVGPVARPLMRRGVDLIVSPNEIASTHGTGILIKRLIHGRPNMLGMRSATSYNVPIEADLVEDLVLPNLNMDRAEIVEQVARWLRGYDVSTITCVPYFETDLLIGLAAKAVTGAPFTVYIMDDNCLNASGIRREVMQEALNRADAVFAISPELRAAYEGQFLRKIWVMPPLVASPLIRQAPSAPAQTETRQAIVLGNIWSQQWLDQLCDAIEGSGWTMTWFTANENPSWLSLDRTRLARAGLTVAATPPVDDLIRLLTDAPFIVVPSGSEADGGHAGAIAKLSLPSRMPFIVATAGTPILVLGSDGTAAAKFVARFDIGEVQAYDKAAFAAAATRLSAPAYQIAARARAAATASLFDVAGAYEHMLGVARAGGFAPVTRYEAMFKPLPGEFAFYVEPPIPPHVYRGFAEIYTSLSRLKEVGYTPDFVMDIGASTGIWSFYASEIYPDATYVLADPMASRYPHKNVRPGFIFEEVAVSDRDGSIVFKVARDLYNSSILSVSSVSTETESIEVAMVTVDGLAAKHGLKGRGILKIDVQYAEHLVLEGARHVLAETVDFVILELTMTREHEQSKTFIEMLNLMDGLDFRPFDDVGGWRSPRSGFLEQKDFVFCRKGLDLKIA